MKPTRNRTALNTTKLTGINTDSGIPSHINRKKLNRIKKLRLKLPPVMQYKHLCGVISLSIGRCKGLITRFYLPD